MKVAIVEWDTKIPVWHSNGTPSYMFDNTRVVDATAFGACASAVNGSLFGYRWFREAMMDQFVSALNKYDVVYLVTRWHWADFLELARRIKTKKVLGFGMGLDEFRSGMQKEGEFVALVDLMKECDRLTSFSYNHTTYLMAMTGRWVSYLPMAYPYKHVMQTMRKKHNSKRIMITGPVWNGDTMGRRDDIGSCLIAAEVLKLNPEPYVEMIDKTMHTEVKDPVDTIFRKMNTDMSRVKVIPKMDWHKFMDWASEGGVSIHWDWCWSTGRIAADMAALAVPHLGGNSDHDEGLFLCNQQHNFPMYRDVGIEFDLYTGTSALEWLLFQDNTDIIEAADEYGLENLDYEPWKYNFERIVEDKELENLWSLGRPDYRNMISPSVDR